MDITKKIVFVALAFASATFAAKYEAESATLSGGAENVNSTGLESGSHYLSGGRNLQTFYNGAMPSHNTATAVQMADGIIEFRLDPYSYNSSSRTFSAVSTTSNDGMSNVDVLRLTLTMMPVEKLNEYRDMVNDNSVSAAEREAYFNKHSRRFTRTYWVNRMAF